MTMKNCPFCGAVPTVHRHKAPPAGDTAVVPGAWVQIECKSEACADRIVMTHRFATEEQAIKAWEFGRD